MRKLMIGILSLALLTMAFTPLTATGHAPIENAPTFSGLGSGTIADPYQITDVNLLQEMGDDLNAHYILMNDIDAASTSTWDVPPGGFVEGFVPVGYQDWQFNGSLEGAGYTISNLYQNHHSNNQAGLFGYINLGAWVSNLTLSNADVEGAWTNVGVLAGINRGDIVNCHSSGVLEGNMTVGGLIGSNWDGNVSYSSSSVTVNNPANDYVGGFVGRNVRGLIYSCEATGSATGVDNYAGGFAGANLGGSIIWCNSTGNAIGLISVGGFVGSNMGDGLIQHCSSTGNANGTVEVGGFAGENTGSNSKIRDSYSTGYGSGDNRVGGFIGLSISADTYDSFSFGNAYAMGDQLGGFVGWLNTGSIIDSWSAGNAIGTSGISQYGGGFVGENNGNINRCNNTGSPFDVISYAGGFAGWNGGTISNSNSSGEVLIGNSIGGFAGYNDDTITNCFSTGNLTGSNQVGGFVGFNNGPITNSYSTGSADGNNEIGGFLGRQNSGTINGCDARGDATGTYDVGGFSGLAVGGTILNSNSYGLTNGTGNVGGFTGDCDITIQNSVANSYVIGTDLNIGGFVGFSGNGNIINCTATGDVNGSSATDSIGGFAGTNRNIITDSMAFGDVTGTTIVGGFVGMNEVSGDITTSYSTGSADVMTGMIVGGFVGYNDASTIENSYSWATASGNDQVGGFVGHLVSGSIDYCYSIGNASGNTNTGGFAGANSAGSQTGNFWDTENSGNPTSADGTGKTTEEMMNIFTFLDADWSFYNPWKMKHTFTYPTFDELVNEAPIIMDDTAIADEDNILIVASDGVLANDVDPDNHWDSDEISVTSFDATSVSGATVNVAADGGFTYDPSTIPNVQHMSAGESVMDTFTYTASDNAGHTASATVTVTLNGINDAPLMEGTDNTSSMTGQFYNETYIFTDIDDSDIHVWTFTTDSPDLAMNTNGTITGNLSTAGTFYINVSIDDGNSGLAYTNYTLNVDLDTDNDGVADINDNDDDNDGWNDTIEIVGGFDPLDNSSMPSDADSDGIADFMDPDFLTTTEYNNQTVNQTVWSNQTVWQNSTNNVTVGVSDADTDGDGWNDSVEILADTDPLDDTDMPADSDGDGIADFMDPDSGAGQTNTVTVTETPAWAWGALIAAIVLGILAGLLLMRGKGGKPEPATQELVEEPAAETETVDVVPDNELEESNL